MGAWGARAFDNDAANDWASGLDKARDLSLVETAFKDLEQSGPYLDGDVGCVALAACEVVARLQGRNGYQNEYTKVVDQWVAAHPTAPSPALIGRALAAIDRTMGKDSELRELWEEDAEWLGAIADLRARVGG